MKPSIKLDSATARPAASARPGRLNYAGLVLLPLLLAMGVAFRVAGIDKKLYWHDEAYTSLRASGYTADEAIAHLFTGDEIGIADIQKYQRYAAEKGLRDTISSLVTEDSEHPPFYFLLVRLWMKWFGDSPGIVRGLSVIFSLLVFPSLYWLCMELFGSRATAWTAVALMAVSPFHVLFAQEARQYSLWALTILVSSAALLRARRLPAKLNWGAYAVAATLGLYTHLFFGFVLVAHALYMAANEGLRLSRTMMSYALACFASLLAFSPWIVLLIQDFNRIVAANEWAYVEADLSYLIDSWILYFSSPFVDYSSGGLAGSLMRVSALALAACS
ncbi:MAG TPA: glycosyltransferase family 39 protein, partial [Blastocatellia bacterium]|nr:glycosyltransferase family 39 protein [Blastocatellia bacterium]